MIRTLLSGAVLFLILGCQPAPSPTEGNATSAEPVTIFLVRHAEKADDGTKDPPLTAAGQARAKRLRDMLISADIEYIYSTDYQRTRQTAQPLADTLGLPVTTYPPFDSTFITTLPERHAGQHILLTGHSNTIPATVNHLTGSSYTDLQETEYDKVFVVSGQEGRWSVVQLIMPEG